MNSVIRREPLSEDNVKNTAVSVVEYLVNVLQVDPKTIVLFGSGASLPFVGLVTPSGVRYLYTLRFIYLRN